MVLWCITTYFNPINYQRRLSNYHEFWNSFKTQTNYEERVLEEENSNHRTTKLLTVELSIKNGKHVLKPGKDADLLIQVHSDSILWHKEQLFNIAIENLPDDCDKICWLDCDLIFPKPKNKGEKDWVAQTIDLLDNPQIKFIQPFSEVHLYDKNRKHIIDKMNSFAGDKHNNELSPTVGFAWGCRLKDIKNMNGFYPYNIVGGGDNLVQMILRKKEILQKDDSSNEKKENRKKLVKTHVKEKQIKKTQGGGGKRFSKKHFKHFKNYIKNSPDITKANLKSTNNIVYHLWHGDTRNRHYADRHYILKENNFDPIKHIKFNNDNCMEWSEKTDKEFKRSVKKYFQSRMEDSLLKKV
jgi:hypothetical protein